MELVELNLELERLCFTTEIIGDYDRRTCLADAERFSKLALQCFCF